MTYFAQLSTYARDRILVVVCLICAGIYAIRSYLATAEKT